MQVLRSKRAGFCMGVALALKKLDKLVDTKEQVATFGPIIHNPFVLTKYAQKGVHCFNNIHELEEEIAKPQVNLSSQEKIQQKSCHLLLRAHGIPKKTEAYLANLPHILLSDATCPKVKDAQQSIEKSTSADNAMNNAQTKTLLLYGDANHPEVDGLVSYAQGEYFISTQVENFVEYVTKNSHKDLVLAAQTTQDRPTFEMLKNTLKQINSHIMILDTICDATRLRQEEALKLAKKVDAMVVVGGKNSGNSKRLAEIVFSQNIPTVFVENAEELQRESFIGVKVVGLTAGASTPKYLVDKTEELLLSW